MRLRIGVTAMTKKRTPPPGRTDRGVRAKFDPPRDHNAKTTVTWRAQEQTKPPAIL
jgi:hypothetical protein